MQSGVIRVVVTVTAVLAGTGLVPASASHPTQMCLDVEPEAAAPPQDDDVVDTLTAFPGSTDAGHPPEHDGCLTEMVEPGQDWSGTNIDFEISGPADPDGSDTPLTPDMTCTVAEGSASCTVAVPEPRAEAARGSNAIRAWIDLDLNDSTTEADPSEGQYEDKEPGDTAEPDPTDVTSWLWTECHCGQPPPPPCDDPPCPTSTRTSIRYGRSSGAFSGSVVSDAWECLDDRTIRVWKAKRGDDRRKGRTTTNAHGKWRVPGFFGAAGPHYVTIGRRYVTANTEPPSTYECLRGRSRTLELN